MASSRGATDSRVTYVQIEGLVAMKIIKHAHEESSGGNELVQGVLLGLVVDNRLEITNCFPFPRHSDEEDFDEVQYQMEMMRNLRHVNIDHLHVGWYQSAYYGAFLNRAFLDSQFNYQGSIEESIVLIYDPTKTNKGFLSLKAYRLTPDMMNLYREGDFSPDMIRQLKITFENMFEEIAIVIKNSHLVNSMLCEVEAQQPVNHKFNSFDLATSGVLEKRLQLLMECVDDLSQDSNKFFNYQRQDAKQKQNKASYIQKRTTENSQRQARGEPPLPEEDLSKLFKPLQAPPRLDSLLLCGQIDAYAKQISEFGSQGLGKLFMADALQNDLQ